MLTFSDMRIDREYEAMFTISGEMARTLAKLTKDKNLACLDEEYAKNTRFKKRICTKCWSHK